MNKNQLTIVTECEYNKPLIHKIDSIIHNCITDCNNKFFQTFHLICLFAIKLTNIANNE